MSSVTSSIAPMGPGHSWMLRVVFRKPTSGFVINCITSSGINCLSNERIRKMLHGSRRDVFPK